MDFLITMVLVTVLAHCLRAIRTDRSITGLTAARDEGWTFKGGWVTSEG